MRRFISLLLATLLVCCVVGCGEKDKGTKTEQSQSEQTQTSQSESVNNGPVESVLEANKVYSLLEVYNVNEISYEDLLNIAYYSGNECYNTEFFQNFKPKEKVPLDAEIELEIKTKLAENYNAKVTKEIDKVKVEDYVITFYFGCYNGYYAFFYDNIMFEDVTEVIEEWETIADVKFRYSSKQRISLWKR